MINALINDWYGKRYVFCTCLYQESRPRNSRASVCGAVAVWSLEGGHNSSPWQILNHFKRCSLFTVYTIVSLLPDSIISGC